MFRCSQEFIESKIFSVSSISEGMVINEFTTLLFIQPAEELC